ncbi:MAG TPA: glutamine-hydrolyzing carbamoyl-phosphate synthase small subunit [Bacteroidaceae bacterium]|nr:glutamine-hydrolyzing carbamoyl-phosphate synthase small subunit [Bacteroidaceae bacterium]
MKISLILADGTTFQGESFGFEQPVSGEIVFNTAMSGYPELLTDPSGAGQLLIMTYPLIGNYGVLSTDKDEFGLTINTQSDRIHTKALIVSDYSEYFSHWNAVESLGEWLKREKVVGMTGVDTRELTRHLRLHGTMTAKIVFPEQPMPESYSFNNLVKEVSCSKPILYQTDGGKKIVLIDCGLKMGILRSLLKKGLCVVRVPWDYDFSDMEFNGVVISNGPGNPSMCGRTIEMVQKVMQRTNLPLLGIDLGCLILGHAAGMDTFKLKFGHHTSNQPVIMNNTERCFITTQNHNYAIREDSLPDGWAINMRNLNDSSVEGITHLERPWSGTMFHSESDVIPTDTAFIYDDFVSKL